MYKKKKLNIHKKFHYRSFFFNIYLIKIRNGYYILMPHFFFVPHFIIEKSIKLFNILIRLSRV